MGEFNRAVEPTDIQIQNVGCRSEPDKDPNLLEELMTEKSIISLGVRGSLSREQVAVMLATGIYMQNKMLKQERAHLAELRESLERERHALYAVCDLAGVAATQMAALYQRPVFILPKGSNGDGSKMPARKSRWTFEGVFTWGNLLSGAGLIIVAMSLFLTHSYGHLKDRVDNQEKLITDKDAQIGILKKESATYGDENRKLRQENTENSVHLGVARNTADSMTKTITLLENQITQQSGQADLVAPLQQTIAQLNSTITNLTKDKATLESKVLSNASKASFKELYEEYKALYEKLADTNQTLSAENAKLTSELNNARKKK